MEQAIEYEQTTEGQIEIELGELERLERGVAIRRDERQAMIAAALAPVNEDIRLSELAIANGTAEIAAIRARLLELARHQYETTQEKTTLTPAGKLTLKETSRLVVDDEYLLKLEIREHKMAVLIKESLDVPKVKKWLELIGPVGGPSCPVAHLEPDFSIAVEFPKEQ